MAKTLKSALAYNQPVLWLLIGLVVGWGLSYVFSAHAAGGSSLTLVPSSADVAIHYSSSVKFNWSTNYKNNSSNTYFNPNIEVICYQSGKWTGMGHVYRLSGSLTPSLALSGVHSYTFSEGDLNRVDYGWNPDQSQPSDCHAALYYFSKGNNKYSELATTTFQITP
jgi:hypothetical protein